MFYEVPTNGLGLSNTFWVGFESGDWLGHARPSWLIFVVYLGSLSCWHVHLQIHHGGWHLISNYSCFFLLHVTLHVLELGPATFLTLLTVETALSFPYSALDTFQNETDLWPSLAYSSCLFFGTSCMDKPLHCHQLGNTKRDSTRRCGMLSSFNPSRKAAGLSSI